MGFVSSLISKFVYYGEEKQVISSFGNENQHRKQEEGGGSLTSSLGGQRRYTQGSDKGPSAITRRPLLIHGDWPPLTTVDFPSFYCLKTITFGKI